MLVQMPRSALVSVEAHCPAASRPPRPRGNRNDWCRWPAVVTAVHDRGSHAGRHFNNTAVTVGDDFERNRPLSRRDQTRFPAQSASVPLPTAGIRARVLGPATTRGSFTIARDVWSPADPHQRRLTHLDGLAHPLCLVEKSAAAGLFVRKDRQPTGFQASARWARRLGRCGDGHPRGNWCGEEGRTSTTLRI
jgi:hypothetical protein